MIRLAPPLVIRREEIDWAGRKLVLVVWLFVGIVVAMLALVVLSVGILSSGRAIVAAALFVWSVDNTRCPVSAA